MKLDPTLRAHLDEMRALTTDASGVEIFVGLSQAESQEYLAFVTGPMSGGTMEEKDRYLFLHDKHDLARHAVLGAEHVKRTEKPTLN